ncbi:sperm-associated antigen 7 [Ischnura elegans]|uniref:sperm-associated antigen 7 n=1 Tax=Ischnura elegans TaxID=197161 RepID=UPI001ED884CB|nr:sperm-associated antigen 7 [Ischnura elegans]
MDILGSILNAMDKPPTISDKQRALMRKQREALQKREEEEKEKLRVFRETVEDQITKLMKDNSQQKHEFEPMEKVFRGIIHDVAEVAGLVAFSVGMDGDDRRVIVYKVEFQPCEEELAALRRGEEWDPEKAKALALQKEEEEAESKTTKDFVPSSDYKDKYERLIGKESAKDAARITQTNKQYGFVPSANKKDVRSIEQTLADLQSRKKMKLSHGNASEGNSSSQP